MASRVVGQLLTKAGTKTAQNGSIGKRRKAVRHSAPGVVGAVLLISLAVVAVKPNLISPFSPNSQDLSRRLIPPAWNPEGSKLHPLGTDQLGRDVIARLAHGGRVSLVVGALTVAVAAPFGLLAGVLAGYYRGRVEAIAMALVDVLLATPFILVAIVVAAVFGAGFRNVLLVLASTGWVVFARLVHGRTLSLRTAEFVEAARALGASEARVLRRHIVPHVLAPFLVLCTLQFGRMMLAEASLSFVGLGVEAERPTWGAMLGTSRGYIFTAPWLVTLPGLAITLAVLGANLLGDWLRRLVDPSDR